MSEQKNTMSPRVAVPSVVWGIIVLVIAGIAFAGSVVDLREVTGASIVWIVIGVGALLVIAALIGAVARAGTKADAPGEPSTDRLTDL